MFQQFLRFLGSLYELIGGLLLTALLTVAAVVTWHFYQEEVFQNQLREQGAPVTVQIDHADHTPRAVWDALGNAAYIDFNYRNRLYETRYVYDTLWVSEGDRITLFYHQQLDRFGQLQRVPVADTTRVVSRLINWSIVTEFSRELKTLGLFLLLMAALLFVGSGLLVRLTGLTIIQTIARALLVVGLAAAASFFTYDAFKYYQYANQLKQNGQQMEVTVTDTERLSHGRKYHWYTYEATFPFKNQQRVVAIDAADHGRLNAGATQLTVLYEPKLNDFIAADYSVSLSHAGVALFLWLLLFLFLRPTPIRRPAV